MDILEKREALPKPIANTESVGTALSYKDISAVVEGQIRPNGEKRSSGDSSRSSKTSSLVENNHESPSSRKKKLRQFAGKTKKATKRLLGASERHYSQQTLVQKDDKAKSTLKDDPAFNLKHLDTEQQSEKGLAAKVQVNLQAVAAGILHPKEGIKGKAARSTAGRVSKIDRPYVSKNMDVEFLEAHDNLSRAQSVASPGRNTSQKDADLSSDDYRKRVEQLEIQRESRRAAYTTSRFVQRVRVVPKRHIDFPGLETFVIENDRGERIKNDWLKWLGHMLLWYTQDFSAQYIDDFDKLPFDRDSLQLHVERLIMASAPWQEFVMSVRSVYRWESPRKTARWFALYIGLWYTQYLMSFVYSYVIYTVVRNRWFPSSVEALRESMHRSHDQRGRAYKLGEMVDKHGRNHWLEPLLDDLGPLIQVQVNDVANMLEVFSK